MRRLVLAIAATAALAVPTVAFADAGGYGSQPGFTESNANTICAGHGAFGAFGTFGVLYPPFIHDFRGGADGQQTGANNAYLCGNPQGNP
jgi:hypothetical protein